MIRQEMSGPACCQPDRQSGRSRLVMVGVLALLAVAGYLSFARSPGRAGAGARALVAQGALLLDVRTPEEFNQQHLPGAVNVPVQELDRRWAEVGPRDRDVVVYCRSGRRSSSAAEILRAHGFTKVHDLGPMSAW
jgi:phage shock protein E